jgi:Reverse transcriptase (RNA-dependent DNA polymerase)/Endonuclease-reverse transcriptase
MTWNANSVRPKRDELHDFLTRHDIAAGMISETRLQPAANFALANYSTYRTDRPTNPRAPNFPGGGVAILVRRGVRHEALPLPVLKTIEAVGVLVHTDTGPLRLFAVYCRPQARFVAADIDALLDSPLPTLVAGDLNSKHPAWNSRKANERGKRLLAHSVRAGFVVAGPAEPTHYHGGSGLADVLDVALLHNIDQSVELETISELSSDHDPVLICIGDQIETETPAPKHDFRRADWDTFRARLDELIDTTDITTLTDLEAATENMTTAIQTAVDAAVPMQKERRNDKFDLPRHLQLAIKAKNKSKRQWQQHRTAPLKTEYNRQTKAVQRAIDAHREERWATLVSELNEADGSTWRMTRKLLNKQPASSPIQGRHHLAVTPRDKAAALAESLEDQFSPNPANRHSAGIERRVAAFLAEQREKPEGDIAPATFAEIADVVSRLVKRKAPGPDGITNLVISELSRSAAQRLVGIVNAVLSQRRFPSQWKTAKVVVFAKAGKPRRDPTSYRPISLLSCLSKVCEKVILRRLQHQVDEAGLLIDQQFGFRAKHSTAHQLLRVTEAIRAGWERKEMTGIVCLDIAKAFDRVYHAGLLAKLNTLGIDPDLVTLVASYLDGRSFFVSHGDARSVEHPIAAGVPQGSLLSPLLYNLYTNDMPTELPGTQIALYADDAAIICTARLGRVLQFQLQDSLDILARYFRRHRIEVNAAKTTATLFTRRTHVDYVPCVALGDTGITWTDHVRYLGVTLDQKLTFRQHIDQARVKAITKLNALRPLLASRTMRAEDKTRLYTTIVRPTMTYGCAVWAGQFPRFGERLQKIQNRALRAALRLPMYARTADVHRQCDVPMLDEYIDALNEPFFAALGEHENQLISRLGDS